MSCFRSASSLWTTLHLCNATLSQGERGHLFHMPQEVRPLGMSSTTIQQNRSTPVPKEYTKGTSWGKLQGTPRKKLPTKRHMFELLPGRSHTSHAQRRFFVQPKAQPPVRQRPRSKWDTDDPAVHQNGHTLDTGDPRWGALPRPQFFAPSGSEHLGVDVHRGRWTNEKGEDGDVEPSWAWRVEHESTFYVDQYHWGD